MFSEISGSSITDNGEGRLVDMTTGKQKIIVQGFTGENQNSVYLFYYAVPGIYWSIQGFTGEYKGSDETYVL